jgi:hypothetical protein
MVELGVSFYEEIEANKVHPKFPIAEPNFLEMEQSADFSKASVNIQWRHLRI